MNNKNGYPYEDRYVEPLGDFPNRLDAAETDEEAERGEARISKGKARGLVCPAGDP